MQVQLSELDKIAIQSYRDSTQRRPIRKPIFDRSRLPKTIGQLAAMQQAVESVRFTSFGQNVQAEMQKAGM
jgi:hypothetical protein